MEVVVNVTIRIKEAVNMCVNMLYGGITYTRLKLRYGFIV